MISILARIISIARMKLLMLPKAKKPNHFACKMGLQTSIIDKILGQNFETKNEIKSQDENGIQQKAKRHKDGSNTKLL